MVVRDKVRCEAIVEEIVRDLALDTKASPGGSPDLAMPEA